GYGNMNLPGQVFMQVERGGPAGIPNVDGYGGSAGGYGQGRVQKAGPQGEQTRITKYMIKNAINPTKTTRKKYWVTFVPVPATLTTEAGLMLTDERGDVLVSDGGLLMSG